MFKARDFKIEAIVSDMKRGLDIYYSVNSNTNNDLGHIFAVPGNSNVEKCGVLNWISLNSSFLASVH
jgi:hypothetical protein